MPALTNYLRDEIARREWSMEDFAHRAHISVSNAYKIVRDGNDNVRQRTFANIAAALGMTPVQLAQAIAVQSEDDPIEQAIRQRAAQMREAVEGIPRRFWPTVIDATFKQAIESARGMAAMADLLQEPPTPPTPVTPRPRTTITQPRAASNRGKNASSDSLPDCPHERINATYDPSLVSFAAA